MKRTVFAGVIQLPPDSRSDCALSTLTYVRRGISAACRLLYSWDKTTDTPDLGSAWSSVCVPGASAARGPEPLGATLFCSECSKRTQLSAGPAWRRSLSGARRSSQGSRQYVPTLDWPGHALSGFLQCGAMHHAAGDRQALGPQHPYALFPVFHRKSALQARCSGAFRSLPISIRCRFLYSRRKAPVTASLQQDRQRRFPYVSLWYE
jgi:hypothetical protein